MSQCPRHPDADTYRIEHDGDLTPAWTMHCEECDVELADSGDGETVDW